jgi:hypothetical protein
MKNQIEQALEILVVKPFVSSYRALDLDMFFFGKRHTTITNKGNPRELGEFVFHVQCAWRITDSTKIIVASRDRWYPNGDSMIVPKDFDWNEHGNRRDKRMEEFLQKNAANDSLIVKAVQADNIGTVKIELADGFEFDIFPDDSFTGEYWRFFKTKSEDEHFIITGDGVK